MDEKLIREKQCADALSVSVRTLRYWRRRKVIPFLKVGALVLYDLDDVVRTLQTYKREIGLSGGEKKPTSRKARRAAQVDAQIPSFHGDRHSENSWR
jgi:DNA-binding transcriptional MerR regulator